MPGLSFLNPAFLLGLLLLAIPVGIHLLTKKGLKEVQFSDLRFLRDAIVKHQRKFKLENRNLLLLRLLIFSLLILAVAKPVLQFSKTKIVKEGDHTQAVIILDNSFSMNCIENGVVRFDRAKRLAQDILRGLQSEDRVSLILASEQPEIVYHQLPVNHYDVREKIESCQAGYQVSDLAQALLLADGILKEAEGSHKEVYLITDLQKNAFQKITSSASGSENEKFDLYLLEVGYPKTGNLALVNIEHQPKRVGPKTECKITFQGYAFGEITPQFVALQLLTQGGGTTETSIPIVSSSAFTQDFIAKIGEEGYWLAETRIEDEVLVQDNQRYLAIPIEQPGRVLLVEGEPRLRKSDWETFYFERALKVYATGASGGRAYDVFRQGVSNELDQLDTSGFDLIVLANVPRMQREIVRKLENFVRRGGSLVISLGSRVDLQSYNEIVSPRLIPCRLDRVVQSGKRPPFRISAYLDKEKPLSIFSKSKQGDLSLSMFTGYINLDLKPDSGAKTLAYFDTGSVALFELPIGRGKVIGWTSSLDNDWNDFPLRPLYLPFWAELLEYLEESTIPPTNVQVGDTVEISMDFGPEAKAVTSLKVIAPDNRIERLEVDPSQGSYRAFFSNTWKPGFYRLQYPEGQGIKNAFPEVFAVNVSPEESDLTRADDDEITEKLSSWNLKRIEQNRRVTQQLANARKGIPLWDLLLFLLLLGLLAETVYANRVWH